MNPEGRFKVGLFELIDMYKSLRHRTRKRICIAFNNHFNLHQDNTVFARLMDRRLEFVLDEYEFLCPLILQHYEFEQWIKPQYANS